MAAKAIDEPVYDVTRRIGDVEVRLYAAYVVAEVQVTGSATAAGSQAFPILAGYIFGKNKGQNKYPMAAPVTQSAAGTKMQMTAPVTQNAVSGGYVVQFGDAGRGARASRPAHHRAAGAAASRRRDPLLGVLVRR
jgi:hypothetical protein